MRYNGLIPAQKSATYAKSQGTSRWIVPTDHEVEPPGAMDFAHGDPPGIHTIHVDHLYQTDLKNQIIAMDMTEHGLVHDKIFQNDLNRDQTCEGNHRLREVPPQGSQTVEGNKTLDDNPLIFLDPLPEIGPKQGMGRLRIVSQTPEDLREERAMKEGNPLHTIGPRMVEVRENLATPQKMVATGLTEVSNASPVSVNRVYRHVLNYWTDSEQIAV